MQNLYLAFFILTSLIMMSFILTDNQLVKCSIPKECRRNFDASDKIIGKNITLLYCASDRSASTLDQPSRLLKPIQSNFSPCSLTTRRLAVVMRKCYVQYSTIVDLARVIDYSDVLMREIHFFQTKGFNVEAPMRVASNLKFLNFLLHFGRSQFKFIDSLGRPVRECEHFERLNITTSTTPSAYFLHQYMASSGKMFSTNRLNIHLRQIEFKEPVCELVFKGIHIGSLYVDFLIETFFKSNRLRFIEQSRLQDLNASVENLEIEM